MRPVNLLPQQHRPKRATGRRGGVAYVALGVLGVILLAVLGFVMTSNQIDDKKSELAKLERDTTRAEQEAGSLEPVAQFLAIKQSREESVRQLAGRRFDWERLTRELARVVPAGSWVNEVDAATDGQSVGGTSGAGATPVAAGADSGGGQPAASLKGCARNQRQVAVLLVRMKKLGFAEDAELQESKHVAQTSDGAAGAAGGGGVAGTTKPCSGYEFTAKVTFAASSLMAPAPKSESVPASLGGGK